jgi:hypothetical protein
MVSNQTLHRVVRLRPRAMSASRRTRARWRLLRFDGRPRERESSRCKSRRSAAVKRRQALPAWLAITSPALSQSDRLLSRFATPYLAGSLRRFLRTEAREGTIQRLWSAHPDAAAIAIVIPVDRCSSTYPRGQHGNNVPPLTVEIHAEQLVDPGDPA